METIKSEQKKLNRPAQNREARTGQRTGGNAVSAGGNEVRSQLEVEQRRTENLTSEVTKVSKLAERHSCALEIEKEERRTTEKAVHELAEC